mmetsp:Transcript_73600/g.238220  ORF Transcript_73600/g.238220 Transcript_73600/m.238220 type:complete len:221 (+) Transcript_73600:1504-2166(+)
MPQPARPRSGSLGVAAPAAPSYVADRGRSGTRTRWTGTCCRCSAALNRIHPRICGCPCCNTCTWLCRWGLMRHLTPSWSGGYRSRVVRCRSRRDILDGMAMHPRGMRLEAGLISIWLCESLHTRSLPRFRQMCASRHTCQPSQKRFLIERLALALAWHPRAKAIMARMASHERAVSCIRPSSCPANFHPYRTRARASFFPSTAAVCDPSSSHPKIYRRPS